MKLGRFPLITTVALLALMLVALWLPTRSARATQSNGLTLCPAGLPDCDHAVIQHAVDAAGDRDIIKVATGVYTDVHVRPRGRCYNHGRCHPDGLYQQDRRDPMRLWRP